MNSDEKIIKDAEELYNKGKWQEAIEVLNKLKSHNKQIVAERNQRIGWCYYYIGIKGDESYKIENLEKAEEYFKLSLIGAKEDKTKISVLNGLPLALWILGKKSEAWKINDRAINKFPKRASPLSTKSILCRWAKDFKKSVEVCEKTYEIAMAEKDFRTAGHAKNNKGDAFLNLGKTKKAKEEYEKAIETYQKYEKKIGESASFHLKRVQEKLSNL